MRKAILLSVIIAISYSCSAQSNVARTPEQIIARFFDLYESKSSSVAMDTLFSYGDKDMGKSLSYLKDTLAGTARSIGGKYNGSELILKKNVTASICIYSYLVKYPISPIRFNFVFYKPVDKWIILRFTFDSNLIQDVEEQGKMYNLK